MTDYNINQDTIQKQSFMTSSFIIWVYYIICLLSVFIAGLPTFLVFILCLISHSIANNQANVLIKTHCSWLMKSIGLTYLAMILSIIIFLAFVIAMDYPRPFDVEDFDNIENDAFFTTMGGLIIVIAITYFWFLYRIIRGMYTFSIKALPKKIS